MENGPNHLTAYRWAHSTRSRYTNRLSYGYYNYFCSDVGTTWDLVWPFIWNDIVYCFLNTIRFILSRIWKIFVRPFPYRSCRFWRPCFIAKKCMCVSLTFKRHMTLYGIMVCFISLVLKSMAPSYTPDSEHILEIAMCSTNKQSLYEGFHLYEKDYIRDAHVTLPQPNQSLCLLVLNYDQVNPWTP